MRQITAYLKLFRITNLLIIVMSQYFFRHFIILPLYAMEGITPPLNAVLFAMIVVSTVCIAAGAYAINDYFDMRIDRINKPQKMILGRLIPRRFAILSHGVLTVIGVLLSLTAAYLIGSWKLGIISLVIATALWFYSFKYKASFLTGNFIIALLSAFVFFIVWLYEFYAQIHTGQTYLRNAQFFNNIMLFFVAFSFITSLIREIIKDIEDIEGDRRVGCKTLPIVWGIKKAHLTSLILSGLNIIMLIIIAFITLKYNKFFLLRYYLLFIAALFIYLLNLILKAKKKDDYGFISMMLKVIMLAGIFIMQLIYISF